MGRLKGGARHREPALREPTARRAERMLEIKIGAVIQVTFQRDLNYALTGSRLGIWRTPG